MTKYERLALIAKLQKEHLRMLYEMLADGRDVPVYEEYLRGVK